MSNNSLNFFLTLVAAVTKLVMFSLVAFCFLAVFVKALKASSGIPFLNHLQTLNHLTLLKNCPLFSSVVLFKNFLL